LTTSNKPPSPPPDIEGDDNQSSEYTKQASTNNSSQEMESRSENTSPSERISSPLDIEGDGSQSSEYAKQASTNNSSQEMESRSENASPSERIERCLEAIFSFINPVGRRLFGRNWENACLTTQDRVFDIYLLVLDTAFLYGVLAISSSIGDYIYDKDFSGYSSCYLEDPLSSTRYACTIIVTLDLWFWTLILGRGIGRFFQPYLRRIKITRLLRLIENNEVEES